MPPPIQRQQIQRLLCSGCLLALGKVLEQLGQRRLAGIDVFEIAEVKVGDIPMRRGSALILGMQIDEALEFKQGKGSVSAALQMLGKAKLLIR